jgi:hypothetical protein
MTEAQNARTDYLLSLDYLTAEEETELEGLLEVSRLEHVQRDLDEIAALEAA